ncbi:hypothetical protein Tco_0824105 [Tanacetum coccineum]|uniref:Uncharacterized protein n=1 Tax=Tanacetum coccineum TaxID=301880 RepID=A0ABQ5AKU4_9ASTR
MILESVENGLLIWPTIEENGVIRTKKYAELSAAEKIQAGCDMKATNIILQGLPDDIYSLVNHHRVAIDLWERVQLLMQGTSLTKQERECKLYDGFDKFTHIKGESLHNLRPEWSKFVTDVKLVKDLHTTIFDQLYAYLEPHELHANEVRLLFCIQQSSTSTTVSTISVWINSSQSTLPIHLSITTSIQSVICSTIIFILVSNESSKNLNYQFPKLLYQSPQVTTQPMTESPLVDSGFAAPVFSLGDDPITCLNKAMAFLTPVASSRGDKVKVILVMVIRVMLLVLGGKMQVDRNVAWYKDKAMLAEAQEAGQTLDEEQLAFLADPGVPDGQVFQTIILHNVAFQTKDLDIYDYDCDDILNAKSVPMAKISNYGSDVISEVPHSETYLNDMENQSVNAMQDFEQTPAVDFTDNEIHSDSNIIPHSQYLRETQQENFQDTNLQTQQDSMILSVIEQICEKMIDSQMDDMIKEKLALKEQVNSLEQNLSKQIKEKECLLQTFTVFKSKSKENEDRYMENEIDLENKIKELDNIIFKVGQSAQTVHMLTKPQAFYGNIHKQALGYQNPFYLKKAQRIKPTLYDGSIILAKHVTMPVIDDEKILILEEESRSKMFEKEKDPEVIKQNISHKPIDYKKINRLSDDFGKRFTPQQELSAKQAFWLRISNPTSKPYDVSSIKIEASKELPKVSLVNESLKNLKFHLAKFDNVVKIRTTPDARTEAE